MSGLFPLDKTLSVARLPVVGTLLVILPLLLPTDPSGAQAIDHSCHGRQATIVGTPGPDRIKGTDGDDVIVALGGSDRIDAGSGNDIVCAGSGRDRAIGGEGHDRLFGGRGDDVLVGGPGPDALIGQAGDDRLIGGGGSDRLKGGVGWDHLDAGPGERANRPACLDRTEAEYCSTLSDSTRMSLGGKGQLIGDTGPLKLFSVETEASTGLDPRGVLAEVSRVLSDPRGWTADGQNRFRRTTPADADIHILVASPGTVDRICHPLRTNGWLSCRKGDSIVLNADRWTGAVSHWTASIGEYRAYLVNHELGHLFGLGHASCPGPGLAAPVMQQQTKSLDGCRPNGWV